MATNDKPLQELTDQELQEWFNSVLPPRLKEYAARFSLFAGFTGRLLACLNKEDFVRIVKHQAGEANAVAVGIALFYIVENKKAQQQADSWTRWSSSLCQVNPGQQAKIEDGALEILRIDKPSLPQQDTFNSCQIEIEDPLLKSWIMPVFLHPHVQLPTTFLDKYPHLKPFSDQDCQIDDKPTLRFNDGAYELKGLPDSFSFDLNDPDFCLCADLALSISTNTTKRSHEIELYNWLYVCFSSGCSDYLERVWRETPVGSKLPFQADKDRKSLSKADLVKMIVDLRKKSPIEDSARYDLKLWQPDGTIGYTKSALKKQLPDNAQLHCLTETVHLGLVAIEHKRSSSEDVEHLKRLAYEMHLICKRQQQLGIKHPVAFGVYWAGVRFILYCMEVRNDRFAPIQLLQRSCEQDGNILLVLQVLWYLRLHGIHLAHLAQQEDRASFQEKANVYPVTSAPTSPTPKGKEQDTGDTDKSKDKSPGKEDDNEDGDDDDNGEGRIDAPPTVRVERRTNKKAQDAAKQEDAVDEMVGWQAMSEMETVRSWQTSARYWVSSTIIHQGSHTLITLGKDTSTHQVVVLKRRLDGDSERLSREADALDQLHGCNGIVQLLDVAYSALGSSKGGCRSMLVLEHVQGRPFLMQAHNCSRARLRFYFHQLIKAVNVCHQNDVVHHDIKNSNVLITDDDQVILIDFDHAVFLSTQERDFEGCTDGFTPPELKTGSYYRATSATDAWGVGIMLLQSLLWTYPITDEAAWSLVEQLQAPEGRATDHLVDWIESTADWDDFRFGHPDNEGPYTPAPWCSEEGLDLARQLLNPDPEVRMDLADALEHPFLLPPFFLNNLVMHAYNQTN